MIERSFGERKRLLANPHTIPVRRLGRMAEIFASYFRVLVLLIEPEIFDLESFTLLREGGKN